MSIELDVLPSNARDACIHLRDGLEALLGQDLVALWAYGAATFPDRPKRLGDVDTHGILAVRPTQEIAAAIDELHAASADAANIEWDSWYVVEADARRPEPPNHAFRDDLVDWAWPLHRAHWLAGQYVGLSGRSPDELVPPPTWAELVEGLEEELEYIDEVLAEGRDDAEHSAFVTWNACRILYSLETRDVVVSKRAASSWALEHLPSRWHDAIRAAGRVYDGEADREVEAELLAQRAEVVESARERLALDNSNERAG